MAQRELALESGVDLIAWAFDPLQAGNARFNLVKLGATARRYVDDMYGPRTDALNLGVPTDRLIAEWDLSAPPRPEPVASEVWSGFPHLIESVVRPDGSRAVSAVHPARGPNVLLEIPPDVARLRAFDARLAEEWRLAVREGLTSAFAAGYRAVGVVQERSGERRRDFYMLQS
jgi:predicted GNAT superfamily acetyltransferase